MFLNYIYVLNHDGYVMEAKYQREIMALPIVGEPVKTFYDEYFPFINFAAQMNEANEVLLIEKDTLFAFTQEEMLTKTLDIAQQFFALVKASECDDMLLSTDKDYPSLFDEALNSMKVLSKNFQLSESNIVFSPQSYQALHNNLQIVSAGTQMATFFNKLLAGFNTILMNNGLIPQSLVIHLHQYQDEEEKTYLDYTRAANSLRNLASIAHHVKRKL